MGLCEPGCCGDACGGCCCCCKTPDGKDEKAFHPEVATLERKCTDILFLLLFFIFWCGMIAVAVVGFTYGNPYSLVYASDYEGQVCGGTNTTGCGGSGCSSYNTVVYPRMTQDIYAALAKGIKNPLNIQLYGVCASKCPNSLDWVCDYQGLSNLKKSNLLSATEEKSHIITGSGTSAAPSAAGLALDTCFQMIPSSSGSSALGSAAGISPWQFLPIGGSPDCRLLMQHCWVTPSTQARYFYRCIGLSDVATNSSDMCSKPAGLKATDPGCVQATITTTTTTQKAAQQDPLQQQMSSAASYMDRYINDIFRSTIIILGLGLGGAFLLGFAWIFFLRLFAGCVVWLTLVFLEILLIAITLLSYTKAGILTVNSFLSVASSVGLTTFVNSTLTAAKSAVPSWVTSTSTTYQTQYTIAAYVFTVLTILFLLIVIAMIGRIKIAVAIVQEASKATGAMPSMMFYPVLSFIWLLALCIWWVVVEGYLHSAKTITNSMLQSLIANNTGLVVNLPNMPNFTVPAINGSSNTALAVPTTISTAQYLQLYHLFGLLWTNQFIVGIGIMTIAGCVSNWYWTADKDANPQPKFAVLGALKRTLRYHTGSIAFGALLVAIIEFIRIILAYIDRKTQGLQASNIMFKIIMKVVQCCMCCFEKCVKYINQNSYIMIAMLGCNFCVGTGKAIKTLALNIAQVATMNFVGEIVMVLGKFVITLAVGFLSYIIITLTPAYQVGGASALSATWPTVLFTMIFGWFVSGAFLSVYTMTIDTIVICFCLDREYNDGGNKPYYMGDELRKLMPNGGGSKPSSKGSEEAKGEEIVDGAPISEADIEMAPKE
jgi:choline transporter-like protein 2/4/5